MKDRRDGKGTRVVRWARFARRSWPALILALAMPVAFAVGADEDAEFIESGRCEFVREDLAGPVRNVKDYNPPIVTRCATYVRKITIWDYNEQERYFGYTTPDTICYINGVRRPCGAMRPEDDVYTIFERKVSTTSRGILLEVRATR